MPYIETLQLLQDKTPIKFVPRYPYNNLNWIHIKKQTPMRGTIKRKILPLIKEVIL